MTDPSKSRERSGRRSRRLLSPVQKYEATAGVPPIPAVANAIYNAIGCRLRNLPMSPIRVLEAVTANGSSNDDG